VIATGFNRAKQKTVHPEASQGDQKADIISYDEWIKMRKGGAATTGGNSAPGQVSAAAPAGAPASGPGDFLVGRNSKEADLNVPTVLREKKYQHQGDG
jgi:hypothetical protein